MRGRMHENKTLNTIYLVYLIIEKVNCVRV